MLLSLSGQRPYYAVHSNQGRIQREIGAIAPPPKTYVSNFIHHALQFRK